MMKLVFIILLLSATSFAAIGWQRGNSWNAPGLESEPLTKTLTADLPDPTAVVDANGKLIINLSSDSAVAPDRDWTFKCPDKPGQLTVVYFTGTGAARLQNGVALDGSCGGTVILGVTWTAAVSGTRAFVTDGTNYLEFPN